jgi:hypothetical protein
MGNRGHLHKQDEARRLRAEAWTLDEIATELGCAKSSASLWTRGVAFEPKPRNRGNNVTKPHPLHLKKLAEIEACKAWANEALGNMSDRDLFMAGIGLYAGDGAKTGDGFKFANSNPDLVVFMLRWLRTFFDVDEERLRLRLYLHQGLDLGKAQAHWSSATGIPTVQFTKPYRPVADASIRHTKHVHGCAHVTYSCTKTLRKTLALLDALLS